MGSMPYSLFCAVLNRPNHRSLLQLTIPKLTVNGVNVKDRNSDIDWPDKSDVMIIIIINAINFLRNKFRVYHIRYGFKMRELIRL